MGFDARGRLVGCVLAIVLGFAASAFPEIIDRVMAIVAGRVITLSEVNAARELHLVKVPDGTDPVAAALDQLVERELVLTEVDRYAPPEPPAAQVESQLAVLYEGWSTASAFATALAQFGYTESQLREILRDDLRIQTYLDQRFAAAAQPTDVDVAQYYREHEADFVVAGELPPMAKIQEEVRRTLAAERRRVLIADWIAGLRRRSEVTVLYFPGT